MENDSKAQKGLALAEAMKQLAESLSEACKAGRRFSATFGDVLAPRDDGGGHSERVEPPNAR